jgi:indolepyruvate ferredoxin oxidoreductase beta subunit
MGRGAQEREGPFNLIIAGVGGQGNIFASQVVARAAMEEGLSVRIAETYGVTQRGGPVYSQIRIGRPVYGPLIPKGRCHLIVGLEPIEALRRAADYLGAGGGVVLNAHISVPLETQLGRQPALDLETIERELRKLGAGQLLTVDARALAEEAGGAATTNVLMLGAVCAFDAFPLSYESVEDAVRAATRPRLLEANLISLNRGRQYARAVKTANHND